MARVEPRLEQGNRRAPPRQQRSVADRPSAFKLLLLRQKRFARVIGIAGLCGVGALVIVTLFHTTQPSESLNSFQERWGRMVGIKVQDVTIEGRANTPEPLLEAALGVNKGDDIYGFSVEQARERIEKLSWVQSVSVERRLPGTVVVELQEKRPFAIWQHNGQFQLIDRNGAVVTNEDLGNFASLPLVVGDGAPEHAVALLDALSRYPGLQTRVVAAVRVGGRRWNLRLNTGADVMLPEGEEDPALKRLTELQSADSLLDRPLSVIDMRLPDRLVVRPATDSHAPTTEVKHPT